MISFKIKIAGFCFEINTNFNWTRLFCKGFFSEEKADYSITIFKDDLQFERENLIKEQEFENGEKVDFSDDYIEHLAVYRKIAEILIDKNIILFHGSAVAVGDVCYLFTAKSGTGKTTHTEFWLKKIDGAYVVNGDKPLLKVSDGDVFVCGTPWRGKESYGTNKIVKLKAICVLERDSYDHVEKVDVKNILSIILQQSYRPKNAEKMIKTLDIIDKICKNVEFYRLGCTMNENSAFVSYNAMK